MNLNPTKMNIKSGFTTYCFIISILLLMACNSSDKQSNSNVPDILIEEGVNKSDLGKDIEILTDFGSIIIRLSDSTPKHRNNFIKLVNQKFYDSLSFHRVIKGFVVQTGDPESKNPETDKVIGESDLPYTIPFEFSPSLFHKRGALGAARKGDDINPNRASSSTQFYIVQGQRFTDSTLNIAKGRINNWLAYNRVIKKPEHKIEFELLKSILENKRFSDSIKMLKSGLNELAKSELLHMDLYDYPVSHREIYKSLGGVAHLDVNYTVFGEVIQGMEVVDSITSLQTNEKNKPLEDVRIIRARLVERQNHDN